MQEERAQELRRKRKRGLEQERKRVRREEAERENEHTLEKERVITRSVETGTGNKQREERMRQQTETDDEDIRVGKPETITQRREQLARERQETRMSYQERACIEKDAKERRDHHDSRRQRGAWNDSPNIHTVSFDQTGFMNDVLGADIESTMAQGPDGEDSEFFGEPDDAWGRAWVEGVNLEAEEDDEVSDAEEESSIED